MSTPKDVSDELATVYARMSGLLLSEETVATALELITSLAKDTVHGTVGSGVTLTDTQGNRVTSAATDPIVEQLDTLQYDVGDGPCLAAWAGQAVVRSNDLDTEHRWPQWTEPARSTGARSVLSAPLIADTRTLGAIKVYSDQPGAYDEISEALLRRFADQAAILIANVHTLRDAEQLSDRLKEALRTRDLIATARGIVMLRDGLEPEQAQRQLLTRARSTRTTLRDTADDLVRSVLDRR
ncbi:GAF domain-containing protein [Rhodococcus sp. NPDC058521]|uniref:GAF domain-containing protein n=1 Tax=Rhodococcus sp. NPDC058521 TaxID=3346536 RepID=UPI00365A4A86